MDASDIVFCNNCRTNIPKSSWLLHEVNCVRHRWYCEICEQSYLKNERQKHEQEFHNLVYCECGEDIEVRRMALHKERECDHRLMPCMYCECPMRFFELSEHEIVCGSRTEPCEKCHKRVQLCKLKSHLCDSKEETVVPFPSPPPPPPLDESQPLDLVICPVCTQPAQDYMLLQEHIFKEHPEVVTM